MAISSAGSVWRRVSLLALVVCLLSASGCDSGNSSRDQPALPRAWLWAWQRPENLEFISPTRAGVAYFAGALHLRGDAVHFERRLQPLRTSTGAPLLAVVRLEPDREWPPTGSEEQLRETSRILLEVAGTKESQGLQVDFDATVSQRPFYAELLRRLRDGMPEGRLLSITALASWCFGDRWAAGLPVDEVVLMAFRMGPSGDAFRDRLRAGEPSGWRGPRLSLGVSLDEPFDIGACPHDRLYLFKPSAWCASDRIQVLDGEARDD